ncbi:hypothetical protein CNR22_08850 [Sphingobacteriaceae bacterium]|nr:hypothetical protein CNR22_08850 [Sphingobacteriaceae bacterium]
MIRKLYTFCLIFLLSGPAVFAQDIFDAARKGDIQRTEALLKLNPDTINKKNAAGFTPLILGAYRNQLKFVEFLLSHKVNVNEDSPEGPALLGACYKGSVEITELLLRNGANANATNSHGTTALIYAAMSNNSTLVKLLLANGAKKNLAEKSGKTALSYAKINESAELIKLLSE